MTDIDLVEAAVFWSLMAILLWVVYGPWQKVWADWYRQRVYESRDNLFDLAAAGELDFSDPRYKILRSSMETEIRFAHRASWPMILYLLVCMSVFNPEERRFEEAFKSLPLDTRRKIEKDILKNMDYCIASIIMRSPFILLPSVIVVAVVGSILMVTGAITYASFKSIGYWLGNQTRRVAELAG